MQGIQPYKLNLIVSTKSEQVMVAGTFYACPLIDVLLSKADSGRKKDQDDQYTMQKGHGNPRQ